MVTVGLFDRIVKVEVTTGPILVLYLDAGVGPPQSGIPPMIVSGIPGSPSQFNVFTSSDLLIKPGGKPVPIVDPVSGPMRANLLTWPQQKQTQASFGQVFLFCNIGAMRQFVGKGAPVAFAVTTPPGAGKMDGPSVNYYWLFVSGAPGGLTFSNNPISPVPGTPFLGLDSVWRDSVGAGGAGNVLMTRAGDPNPAGNPAPDGYSGVVPFSGATVFTSEVGFPKPPFDPFIASQPFNLPPKPDTTQWGLRAALWRKQKSFSSLIPVFPDQTFPTGSPPPDSFAFMGGGASSTTVTVTVTPGTSSTVKLS